jgi:hypothetical protein
MLIVSAHETTAFRRLAHVGWAAPTTPAIVPNVGWAVITSRQGRAEWTVDPLAGEEMLLLVSAIAPPQTTTTIRINVDAAETSTPLEWQSEWRMAAPGRLLDKSNPVVKRLERQPGVAILGSRTILWPAHMGGDGPFAMQAVRSREVCRGERVAVVWDEEALDERSHAFAESVVDLLEQSLLPCVEAAVGPCADIDGEDRLTVAVSPRIRQLDADHQPLFAFVRAADFRPDGDEAWSNRAAVIYLAPHVEPERLPAILAHELAHAAQFCELRTAFGDAPWPLSEWLLEGHAHAVEAALTGDTHNLAARWEAFQAHPERSPLVMTDAAAIGRWRDPGSRGATAAFCLWLTDRFGWDWWRRLPALLVGEEDAWPREFGLPFAELYRRWTIDLAHPPSGGRQPPDWSREVGPIRTMSLVQGNTTEIALIGTATAYCVLPTRDGVPCRVRAVSDETADLQLTVVRRRSERRVTAAGPRGESALRR